VFACDDVDRVWVDVIKQRAVPGAGVLIVTAKGKEKDLKLFTGIS
jgi:hypothetical protein